MLRGLGVGSPEHRTPNDQDTNKQDTIDQDTKHTQMKMDEQKSITNAPAYYKPTQPSMHRRCKGWDYKGRGIYMLTLIVADRQPLLGKLVTEDSGARIEKTPIGESVASEAEDIPNYYPQIRVLCKQVMPDHLHLLLYVEEPLPVHLTSVVSGFKTGCTKAYKSSLIEIASTEHPETTQKSGRIATVEDKVRSGAVHPEVLCAADFHEAGLIEQKRQGGLWEDGYHDRILFHKGQPDAMIN